MEYPFKDLLPLDEVLEREGYYKDWTHLDPEVFYSLTQISEYIKTKGYGVDVRLLIAQLAEHFGLKTTQIVDLANLLQQKFTNLEGVTNDFTNNVSSLVAQMQADKDAVIANATVDSEVILARGGKATLGARLDETTSQLAQTMQNVITINVEQWGLTEADAQGNTLKLNNNIASLDDNKLYEIVIDKVYNISGQIDVINKLIKFSGFGGFKATTAGTTVVRAEGCFGITFKDVLIDGNGLAVRGIDLENCPHYTIDNARIENIGNTSLDNVYGLFLSFGNDYGVASRLKVKNIISSSVSTGINIDNWRDRTKFSKGLRFDNCEIKNVQPVADGDGFKVLQGTTIDSDLLIENTRFIQCAKRGIKTQAKGVHSRNNYFEDSFHASIDFQLGGGVSENDIIVITEGASLYQLVAVSGNDCVIKGLKAKSLSMSTNTRGIVVSDLAGKQINQVIIDDVEISGVDQPLQITSGLTIDSLSILNSMFLKFTRPYVGTVSGDVKILDLTIDNTKAIRTGTYYGFINLSQATLNSLVRYRITNNDIGFNSLGTDFARKQGFVSRNISHSFEEEYGVRRSFANTIPSSTTSTLYFHAKKGDIAINTNITELGDIGSKYIVKGWVCISDGDVVTSNRGTWVQDRALTGN